MTAFFPPSSCLHIPFQNKKGLSAKKQFSNFLKQANQFLPFHSDWSIIIEPSASSNLQIQFAATVPKKKFPKAVQRNRIRRQMKESYRLEKHLVAESLNQNFSGTISLMMIYVAKEALPYAKIDRATKYLVQKLIKTLIGN